jgi:hypothetical protein
MDEELIKDFESKLGMFENSLKSIADNFSTKLSEIAVRTSQVAENTEFLKKMKTIFDGQNKKLLLMETTVDELIFRLDALAEEGVSKKKRKKK